MSNPADRLHKILTRSKDKALQKANMMQGWRQVLNLPNETGDLLVMNKVGKVFTLPFIISIHLQRFADLRSDLYLNWSDDLCAAFRHVQFSGSFQEFSTRLSDKTLVSIEFCADQLTMRMPEKAISSEELDAIRLLAWNLYQEILKCDSSSHLSRYLLDHLYLIIEAIDDYDITGAAGMERSLNTVAGAVGLNQKMAEEVQKSAFGKRFWNIVTKVNALFMIGKTLVEITEGIQNIRLPPTP